MDIERIKRELEVLHSKNYLVEKSNDLIQKSRFKLTVTEQKVIAYICSIINPKIVQLEYEFDLKMFAEICDIQGDSGRYYNLIEDSLAKLRNKDYRITLSDGTRTCVSWINKWWIPDGKKTIKIRLDEDMMPFLFNLQDNYTKYELGNVLKMKSRYSIQLYELLKSYRWQGARKEFDVEDLKQILGVDDVKSYKDFSLFRKKVIEIAIKEINEYSNMTVTTEYIKTGRKVTKIIFYSNYKSSINMLEMGMK